MIYSWGGGDPSPTGAIGLGGAHYDLWPVTRGFLYDGGSEDHDGVSTYGGQRSSDAGLAETPPASEGGIPGEILSVRRCAYVPKEVTV